MNNPTRQGISCPTTDELDMAPQLLVVALADATLLAVDRALDGAHLILAATKRVGHPPPRWSPPSTSPPWSSTSPPNSPACCVTMPTRSGSRSETSTSTTNPSTRSSLGSTPSSLHALRPAGTLQVGRSPLTLLPCALASQPDHRGR
jgi:hypothetical protein